MPTTSLERRPGARAAVQSAAAGRRGRYHARAEVGKDVSMRRGSATRLIGSLVGVAGVVFSLTLMFRSMRSVQSIGGFCASGGSAYTIQHHCPKGIGWLLPLLLAWPALFLSLGWNFLDYGLHLTVNGSGVNAGFLVSGVVFIVMGAVPLIWLLPILWRLLTGRGEPPGASVPSPTSYTGVRFNSPASSTPASPAWGTGVQLTPPPTTAATTTASSSRDVASELERLASLHRRGELTDAEYDAAKQRAIAANPT
jgi:hypothetical protein